MNTGTTRRHLLSVAGGFALAASGLFLPEKLENAAAREGALDGAKGGRRGQDHKGRHRRRTHGDNKAKHQHDQPPGAGLPLFKWVGLRGGTWLGGIAYGEVVDPSEADLYYRIKGQGNEYTSLKLARTVKVIDSGPNAVSPVPGSGVEYLPERYRAAIYLRNPQLSGPIFLEAGHDPNIFSVPWVRVYTGGAVDGNGNYSGGTFLGEFDSPDPNTKCESKSFDLGITLTMGTDNQTYPLSIRITRDCQAQNDHRAYKIFQFAITRR